MTATMMTMTIDNTTTTIMSDNDALSSSSSSSSSSLSSSWTVLCCLAVSFQLLRMSMDLIQTASQKTSKYFKEDHHGGNGGGSASGGGGGGVVTPGTKKNGIQTKDKQQNETVGSSSYGSLDSTNGTNGGTSGKGFDESRNDEEYGDVTTTGTPLNEEDKNPLLLGSARIVAASTINALPEEGRRVCNHFFLDSRKPGTWSFRFQAILLVVLLVPACLRHDGTNILPESLVWTSVVVVAFNAILTYRDVYRNRFGVLTRLLYLAASLTLGITLTCLYYEHRNESTAGDEVVVNSMGLFAFLSLGEAFFVTLPVKKVNADDIADRKPGLSRAAIITLLKPYFWPDATSDSAMLNRVRAILTWVSVILSKVCNLASPILLGWASTALAHEQYGRCIYMSVAYSMVQFFGAVFKEGQSLIYLKVAQAAFVQLSETTFVHLHQLSFDWHIRKKLGEVVRSMDRGIAACDTLMKYLFLWLVPALAECLVVCIIFATYFHYTPLAITVFYFVWLYIVWTILLTLWRKKFRKAVVKSDNEWHDRATDSLINYDTVKFFSAEEYERQRFGESVKKYQAGSVAVQASLSFLNISQRFLLQICLAFALSLAALGIKQRIDCCMDHGCDSGVSECCQAIDQKTCPGMEVGDFVAVLTYTLQLFTPLNFLGSVYNSIVMAIIDLTNLSELLAQNPDIVDAPGAVPLPPTNEDDPDIAVEFDNVIFHYPTQSSSQGLRGVSFKMKRGTTTAIVGPTGAGKTTISRLFFRFYDVLGGAVKVNGKDVRSLTQKSLRGNIGVVPQAASLFNDTIRANLRYGRRDATQEELDQAARDAQILDFITSLKDGWDTVVGDRGLKLSGGEKQRTAIARCLLKDPPLVLLDEATSALDTITEKSVQEALDRLGSQRTVLVIAHRLGTIRNADNIIVLKDGVVAEQGTHEELLERDGIYREMWNMQLHATSNAGSQVSLLEQDE